MKTTQMTLWANYSELAIARESANVTLRDSKAGTWPRKLYSVKKIGRLQVWSDQRVPCGNWSLGLCP